MMQKTRAASAKTKNLYLLFKIGDEREDEAPEVIKKQPPEIVKKPIAVQEIVLDVIKLVADPPAKKEVSVQDPGDKIIIINNADNGTIITTTTDSAQVQSSEVTVSGLGESGDEYTDSLLEIARSRSRGSIVPPLAAQGGRRRSSGT
jgi:hypothetical protein